MRLHKIRGVEKDVCTVEQKIAYNMAFNAHINFGDQYEKIKESGCEAAIAECVIKIRDIELRWFQGNQKYKKVRCDIDGIFVALNNGLRNYLDRFFIANDYEIIGERFPIPEAYQ